MIQTLLTLDHKSSIFKIPSIWRITHKVYTKNGDEKVATIVTEAWKIAF